MCRGTPSAPRGSSRSAAELVGQHDLAGLEHVAALGDVEREVRVLLDQQDRRALLVDLGDRLVDALDEDRRDAHRRLVEQQQLRARPSARARSRASAARRRTSCPPSASRAPCRRGNSSKTRSRSSSIARCRGAGRRRARGSRARSCAGSTCGPRATARCPSRTMSCGGDASRSPRPSKRIEPVARRREPGDRAQRRRLAGAVGADQRDALALLDGQRDALERLDVAVVGVDVVDLEERHRPLSRLGLLAEVGLDDARVRPGPPAGSPRRSSRRGRAR